MPLPDILRFNLHSFVSEIICDVECRTLVVEFKEIVDKTEIVAFVKEYFTFFHPAVINMVHLALCDLRLLLNYYFIIIEVQPQ